MPTKYYVLRNDGIKGELGPEYTVMSIHDKMEKAQRARKKLIKKTNALEQEYAVVIVNEQTE